MPELWNDPVASEDFESTFFEYIEYVANSPNKRKPRVPSRILSRIEQGAPATPDSATIRRELQALLGSRAGRSETGNPSSATRMSDRCCAGRRRRDDGSMWPGSGASQAGGRLAACVGDAVLKCWLAAIERRQGC